MGHVSTKQEQYLNDSYFRATVKQHLTQYRKAIPGLTILAMKIKEVETLKQEIEKLKEMVSVLLKPGQTRKDVEEQARLKIMLKQELKKLGIVTHVEDKKGKRTIKPA